MISLFQLRKNEPNLARPFRVPFYPFTPAIALALAVLCLGSLIYYNAMIAAVYLGVIALGYAWYFVMVPKTAKTAMGTGLVIEPSST
jgi:ethanolamine permease